MHMASRELNKASPFSGLPKVRHIIYVLCLLWHILRQSCRYRAKGGTQERDGLRWAGMPHGFPGDSSPHFQSRGSSRTTPALDLGFTKARFSSGFRRLSIVCRGMPAALELVGNLCGKLRLRRAGDAQC